MKMVIESVGPTRQIVTKYGSRVVYSVKFQQNENWADVMQKPDLPPPSPGQELDGEIEKNQYGYSFKKAQTGFAGAMRTGGYSNRQVALQCAARITSNYKDALEAAEKLLAWLEVTSPTNMAGGLTKPENSSGDRPPIESYNDLGLN
jgi:hypothetical protein